MNKKFVLAAGNNILMLLFFFNASCHHNIIGQQNDSAIAKTDTDIVASNAQLRLISDQFSFTEGPAADKAGNVYFTDQPNNKIWKYSTDGTLSVYLENAGRSNGLYIDKDGNLISCADEHNQLWSISPEKKITVLVTDINGLKLNGPNDLWIHPDGDIYFTDPYYQRNYWTRKHPELKKQNVYLLKGGHSPEIVDSSLVQPNGIIGSADGKKLFVADIGNNKTYRYTIQPNGTINNRQLFANQGSDGMTIDNRGNIYLSGNGVTVYNADGEKIKHISIPGKWTANLTFGGKNKNLLFITSTNAVYLLEMKVRGVNF